LLSGFIGFCGCWFIFHTENKDRLRGQVLTNIEAETPVDSAEHCFKPLHKKIFYSPQERREFFKKIGVEYCNDHIFEYQPILEKNAKESEKYLEDIEHNDALSLLHADDIAAEKLMPMSIRWIDSQVGHGIFAEEDLAAGGFVGVYGGQVQDRLLVDSKDYAWSYPAETADGGRITLDGALQGNELRLINDGKDPNCIVEYIIGKDNLWHVCYLAAKDIKKGEQLLVSYGPAYWETRDYKYQELAQA
jgi:SET domain